jgi:hypothetical protein
VKGPGDDLSETQKQDFTAIAAITGEPVRFMKFRRTSTQILIDLWDDFRVQLD